MKPNTKRLKTRLAVRHQRAIRIAVRNSVNTEDIVSAWFANFPEGTGSITPDDARAWARVHVIVDTKQVRNALYNLYADSVVLGTDLSLYLIGRKVKANKAAPSKDDLKRAVGLNWATWRPGNRAGH